MPNAPNMPDVNLPDVNLPDVNLPDVNIKAPDINIKAPDMKAPDIGLDIKGPNPPDIGLDAPELGVNQPNIGIDQPNMDIKKPEQLANVDLSKIPDVPDVPEIPEEFEAALDASASCIEKTVRCLKKTWTAAKPVLEKIGKALKAAAIWTAQAAKKAAFACLGFLKYICPCLFIFCPKLLDGKEDKNNKKDDKFQEAFVEAWFDKNYKDKGYVKTVGMMVLEKRIRSRPVSFKHYEKGSALREEGFAAVADDVKFEDLEAAWVEVDYYGSRKLGFIITMVMSSFFWLLVLVYTLQFQNPVNGEPSGEMVDNFFSSWGLAEVQRHFGVDGIMAIATAYLVVQLALYLMTDEVLNDPMFLDGQALRKAAKEWEDNDCEFEESDEEEDDEATDDKNEDDETTLKDAASDANDARKLKKKSDKSDEEENDKKKEDAEIEMTSVEEGDGHRFE